LCPSSAYPTPRKAALRALHDPTDPTEILDPGALVLYFASPHSVTGEDVLELHLHGGPAIVRAVLAAIPTIQTHHRIRPAGPGEFTRRAFANERLSLPQIEALGDTLAADTEQQRRLSVRASSGALAARYETWRQALVSARGELEALIDFSEDQQLDASSADLWRNVISAVKRLKSVLEEHVGNAVRGELLRSGISLTLIGAPNAGKSSLLNRVVGREAAIVSKEAGTTRDVVDLSVDLGGYMVLLGDTAGLRVDDVGGVEKEGIRRAKQRLMDGHVIIVVLSIELQDGVPTFSIPAQVVEVVNSAEGKELVAVVNKMDLLPPQHQSALPQEFAENITTVLPRLPANRIFGITCTSSSPADGIQTFLNGLTEVFASMTATVTSDADSIGATDRQRRLIDECILCLDAFLNTPSDVVVAAEELRFAAECLAKITGRGEGAGDVEEVLAVVFERFCVGK
jgi:tRNA modification GTPase TrmE